MGRTGDQHFDVLKGPQVLVKFEQEKEKRVVSSTGRHRGSDRFLKETLSVYWNTQFIKQCINSKGGSFGTSF